MLKKVFYSAVGVALLGTISAVIATSSIKPLIPPHDSTSSQDVGSTTPTKGTTSPISVPSASANPPLAVDTESSGHTLYGVRTKTSGCTANQALPDPACSPGAVLTTDTSLICVSGYTQTVRDVPVSEKEQVFAEYGIDWSLRSGYEVDHIISLELGGSNDISNLFPEPYSTQYGARVKDKLENYLHDQVCHGRLPIALAQREISTDWLEYYLAWQTGVGSVPSSSSTPAHSTLLASSTPVGPSNAEYYTSSYPSSKYYYRASCSAWHGLSAAYLVSFSSLQALLAEYPHRTLSPQC
jgi:hypothetical protein